MRKQVVRLCDSVPGKTYAFEEYLGAADPHPVSENGVTYDVVMSLMSSLLGQGTLSIWTTSTLLVPCPMDCVHSSPQPVVLLDAVELGFQTSSKKGMAGAVMLREVISVFGCTPQGTDFHCS